ncbi:MAG: peptidase M28, partial [Planctomycetota bacterium]
MDLDNGDIRRVSPGSGKTTCAWIHPDGDRVLFANTSHDATAIQKQKDELELRASGRQRRYAWDYDPQYELYQWTESSAEYRRLTDAMGYDAEASYSPDGTQIVFASNRSAFERELTQREQRLFQRDPASMIDLYIMDADGSNVRRLTDVIGYDGGPFFSSDGQRICWRRFSEDGASAEIYTMSVDGGDVRRLTQLQAMSWAPYFHPSGDYLIFTTNLHGFANFELYLVRADGKGEPVRVTYDEGFDGLPVFLPDGKQVSWTSNRTSKKQSQIFLAQWDDRAARIALGLIDESGNTIDDAAMAASAAAATDAGYRASDVGRHVNYLTSPELQGRLTGTEGERRATAYVAAYLETLGFQPAAPDGSWFHEFTFPAGAKLTEENDLKIADESFADSIQKQWQPLAFSASGNFRPLPVVFAGYGMTVPETKDAQGKTVDEYDSYVHLDVKDKWVMVLRDLPQEISTERRQQLARFSSP